MRHEIPATDWTTALAAAIEQAADGDTIACHSKAMLELAERARKRMCPKKTLVFEIEESVF